MTRLQFLCAVVACFITYVVWSNGEREAGELREKIRARDTVIAALAKQAHATDTVYTADTVTLTRWRNRYDLAPAIVIRDTVWIPKATADSTVHACSVALETCEHRVAVRDSIIAAKEDLLRLERKRRPSWLKSTTTKLLWGAAGYGIGRAIR